MEAHPKTPTPQGIPSARVFTWDWREQPDMAAIATAVTELSGGRVLMREVETGSDQYAWVISDAELTDEQAWRLYSGETVTSTKGD